MAAGRQWRASIKDADVVEPEEAALKDVHPVGVFAIDPPSEIQQQLLEDSLEEDSVACSTPLLLDLVNAPRRPGVNRWINVAEGPLISRQLTVRMHVPLAQHQQQLVFCKF